MPIDQALTHVATHSIFLAADTYMFDGNANQTVCIIPSTNLIVLRTGDTPPKQPEWENAAFLNTILQGLKPGNTKLPPQQ